MEDRSTTLPGIELVDSGEGPPLLFVPGSYSTPAAWRPIQRTLPPGFRCVSTSLNGYGNTDETRSHGDAGIEHGVRVVEAVAAAVGGPVHLVAHSFGGSVALAAALAGRIPLASLALFEANPVDLLRHDGHAALHASTHAMSRDFEAAVAAGEPEAPGRIIDFWGRSGAWAAMPEAVRAYCRSTVRANVFDWHAVFGFEIDPDALGRLDVPVLLVRGALASPEMVALTDVIGARLPNVRRAVVDGAGHFLVTSHAQPCGALLAAHLAGHR